MSDNEKLARENGFASFQEMLDMVGGLDPTKPSVMAAFEFWKLKDGTKAGLGSVRPSGLEAENDRLRDAIKKHRDQRGDDRCWLDDRELYAVLGDGDLGDNHVGDKAAMLGRIAGGILIDAA